MLIIAELFVDGDFVGDEMTVNPRILFLLIFDF